MQLKMLKIRTKCDNGCCKNPAAYTLVRADTPVSMRLNFCKACLTEIESLIRGVNKFDRTPDKKE